MRNHQKVYQYERKAACVLQAGFRAYFGRKQFLEKRDAALQLQALARGFQARKDVHHVRQELGKWNGVRAFVDELSVTRAEAVAVAEECHLHSRRKIDDRLSKRRWGVVGDMSLFEIETYEPQAKKAANAAAIADAISMRTEFLLRRMLMIIEKNRLQTMNVGFRALSRLRMPGWRPSFELQSTMRHAVLPGRYFPVMMENAMREERVLLCNGRPIIDVTGLRQDASDSLAVCLRQKYKYYVS